MEQEKQDEVISDSRQSAREKFEIEGIGEFRAKPGTAVAELAGAASYWEKQAKRLENAIWNARSMGFRDGFIAGASATFTVGALIATLYHFLVH